MMLSDSSSALRMIRSRWLHCTGAFALMSTWPALAQDLPSDLDARVAHAQQFVSAKMIAKVRNSGVAFNWIGNSDRFWFRKGIQGGSEFIVVDAATGRQEPLFDGNAMMNALVAGGMKAGTPIQNIMVPAGERSIFVTVPQIDAPCRWPTASGACDRPTIRYQCDLPVTSCTAMPAAPGADVVLSPDRKRAAFVREHNLWVRDLESGQERQLTTQGVEHFAYGETHAQTDTLRVARARAGLPDPLSGILWSPDGRFILSIRHDLRNVPERLVATEYLPADGGRPKTYTARLGIASDEKYPDAAVEAIEVGSGSVRRVDVDPTLFGDYTAFYYTAGLFWWSEDSNQTSFLGFKRGGREVRLIRIDMRSGSAKELMTEKAATRILPSGNAAGLPNVRLLKSGREAIWYSDRSGWGHLYLYDLATGRVKRQITTGDWAVVDLLRVDEATRTVYFTATGRERGRNPYYRHLYRVGLDGGEPKLLTPENADHEFATAFVLAAPVGGSISPSGRYLIDSYSTVAQPDKVVLKAVDGRKIADVVEADISDLTASGWRPPEQFVAKAADGKTDLYGTIVKPQAFDPSKKYPVIEVTYPGQGGRVTPTTFRDNFLGGTSLNAHAFAEIGSVVVALDSRGGGLRSKSFRTAFAGTDDILGAADHVSAIRDIATSRPYMDLNRVGITGHSMGGYATTRSMLLFPDFYKVGVSGVSPADWLVSSIDIATEGIIGVPSDQATIDYYRRISIESIADRLDGKLLVIFAGLDENVPLQSAFQTFAAFENANKVYDTLIIPNSPHHGGREPYGVMRTIRYLAEHLGGPR